MQDLKQLIGKNITKLRTSSKLTQAEFAEQLNYTDKAVSKWERGESLPDIVILKQIADMFGVKVDYLLSEHFDDEKPIVGAEKKIRDRNNSAYGDSYSMVSGGVCLLSCGLRFGNLSLAGISCRSSCIGDSGACLQFDMGKGKCKLHNNIGADVVGADNGLCASSQI